MATASTNAPTLYTAGYQSHTVPALFAAAKAVDGQILDIRMNPYSPNPDWQKANLLRVFQGRYQWAVELGNRNYRQADRHKGVQIYALEHGLARVMYWLEQGRTPILLCACADFETCHRKVVADALIARGVAVREQEWNDAK